MVWVLAAQGTAVAPPRRPAALRAPRIVVLGRLAGGDHHPGTRRPQHRIDHHRLPTAAQKATVLNVKPPAADN
jgi:hypothetical protein